MHDVCLLFSFLAELEASEILIPTPHRPEAKRLPKGGCLKEACDYLVHQSVSATRSWGLRVVLGSSRKADPGKQNPPKANAR